MDHVHGWKSRVAKMLGVTSGYISKVLAGSATRVSAETLKKAVVGVGVDNAFFEDRSRDDPDFELYLRSRIAPMTALNLLLDLDLLSEAWGALSADAAEIEAQLRREPARAFMDNPEARKLVLELCRRLLQTHPVSTAVMLALQGEAGTGMSALRFVHSVRQVADAVVIGNAAAAVHARTKLKLDQEEP